MLLTSALRFIDASKLATGLLAGLVGVAAGGTLAVAAAHNAPFTTQETASTTTQQTSTDATPGDQNQATGHGADVTAAVAKCKAALTAGQHGIGKCVSAVANLHGKTVSSTASQNGHGNGASDSGTSNRNAKP